MKANNFTQVSLQESTGGSTVAIDSMYTDPSGNYRTDLQWWDRVDYPAKWRCLFSKRPTMRLQGIKWIWFVSVLFEINDHLLRQTNVVKVKKIEL